MKALGLLAFAMVFVLSSAYADKGKGGHKSLLEPEDHRNVGTLQRRKPPVKIPGPALMANDQFQEESNLRQLSEDQDSKNVYLASDKNKKHASLDSHDHGKEKEKKKHIVNEEYNVDNGEETQQERNKSLRF